MAMNAGQVITRINLLRSKIAVVEMLSAHLMNNYTTLEDERDDEGKGGIPTPPEMFVDREDFARVPEAHIIEAMEDLRTKIEEYRAELEEWEGMTLAPLTEVKKDKKGKKNAEDHDQHRAAAKVDDGGKVQPGAERRAG